MKTICSARAKGRELLKNAGIDTYALDTDLLLMHALKIDKNVLLTNPNQPIDKIAATDFQNLLESRLRHKPIQYILGKCEFMSLEFIVNENVLLPRPDTEILVETILSKEKSANGLEIGVGSGCISISLAYYGENITMLGVDISPDAVEIARKNQKEGQVEFRTSDLFENVPRGTFFDFVVSNPPYIKAGDIGGLGMQVKDYEPKIALDGGVDGLEFYRQIVRQAKEYLAERGRIYFEIGHDQGLDVKNILVEAGFDNIKVVKDLAGRDRVVCATCI